MKKYFGLFLALMGSLFLILFARGIHADVNGGNISLLFLITLIPIVLNLYSIIKNSKKFRIVSLISGIVVTLILFLTLSLIDKPILSEAYDLYNNIYTIVIGCGLLLFGLLISFLFTNEN